MERDYNCARRIMGILFIGALTFSLFSACQMFQPEAAPTVTLAPTLTPEPIIPTRTPVQASDATAAVTATRLATATSTATATATIEPSPTTFATAEPELSSLEPLLPSGVGRFGITGGGFDILRAMQAGLPFGAYLTWNIGVDALEGDAEFWQMVRINERGIRRTTWDEIELAIEANPGSYWMVGNEPDVRWQDNVTPQRYAEIYHAVSTYIKERDPEAKLVIGGVTQPTPLRRAYLDIVLNSYREKYGQEMPIDVWNVHAFTLREERDSWGVDIPPGMDDELAIQYEIEDHDNLEILEQNLIDFRSWMADRGYGDKPLIISEYGILMPEDYGFPTDRVAKFMTGTFDLFQTLSGDTGYALDGGRLIQQWFWYSVLDTDFYPTGDLITADEGKLTALGEIWVDYISNSIMENQATP